MKKYETPICIIGAGPAGILASLTLSKHGINHIIVDAETFPRQKPCADIIVTGTLRILNEINPAILQNLRKEGKVNPIWKNEICLPNNVSFCMNLDSLDNQENEPRSYSITRYELDYYLLNYVKKEKYATVKEGCRIVDIKENADSVELKTASDELISAQMMIIATGSSNSILKFLGRSISKDGIGLGIRTYFKNVGVDSDKSEFHIDYNTIPGALYLTPMVDNVCNVNLVLLSKKAQTSEINMRKLFFDTIENNPILKEKFKNATQVGKIEGAVLNLGYKKRNVTGNRYLICGDSAGLIDILSANGIPQAMLSGRMAAMKAIEAIHANDFSNSFLYSFQEALHKRMKNRLQLGRMVYPFVKIDFMNRFYLFMFTLISRNKNMNNLILELVNHKKPLSVVFNPLFYYRHFFGTKKSTFKPTINTNSAKLSLQN